MNKLIILFITAITAITLTGCWSAATEIETNTETANANLQPNTNNLTVGNLDGKPANNPPENAQKAEQNPMFDAQSNKVGNHVRTGKTGEDSEEMKQAARTRQFRLAPESSLISNEMNAQGNPVQTRKFGNNPMLDKVEIIALSEKENKILLYLKNGKVLPLEKGKITDPMTAASSDLLKAVGVEPAAPEQ